MWSVRVVPGMDMEDALLAELWERGTAGIVEEPDGAWRVFFEQAETAGKVAEEFAGVVSGLQEEPAQMALADAGEECEPVYVGSGFVIVPAGRRGDFDGRHALEVNAAMAFGSGRHETTQLCVEALELCVRGGETVLDVGCGSGILAMAARALGAAKVIACDIHEEAIRMTRENFAGAIFQGSADSLASGSGDIVVANISARINDRIAADLQRVMKPDGLLIASGFVRENLPKCFQPQREFAMGDWLCWICGRDGIRPNAQSGDVNVHPIDWWM